MSKISRRAFLAFPLAAALVGCAAEPKPNIVTLIPPPQAAASGTDQLIADIAEALGHRKPFREASKHCSPYTAHGQNISRAIELAYDKPNAPGPVFSQYSYSLTGTEDVGQEPNGINFFLTDYLRMKDGSKIKVDSVFEQDHSKVTAVNDIVVSGPRFKDGLVLLRDGVHTIQGSMEKLTALQNAIIGEFVRVNEALDSGCSGNTQEAGKRQLLRQSGLSPAPAG
jgi:hypothetical protein